MKVNATVWVNLPSREIANKIMSRAIMIKEIIDVFSYSDKVDYDQLLKNTDEAKLVDIIKDRPTFKFSIEGVGRHINMKEQIEIIEKFSTFPFHTDDVRLTNPDIILKLIENVDDGKIYLGLLVAAQRKSEKSGKHT